MLHALRKDLINIGHMALISNVEGIPRDPSDAPAPRAVPTKLQQSGGIAYKLGMR